MAQADDGWVVQLLKQPAAPGVVRGRGTVHGWNTVTRRTAQEQCRTALDSVEAGSDALWSSLLGVEGRHSGRGHSSNAALCN